MILDMFRLDDKVAIVTGANTGLGQGMCVALAEAGARVAGAARSDCGETAKMIEPGRFHAIEADLSNRDSIEKIIDETLNAFGRIDILVNNAGIIRRNDVLEFSEQDWDDVLNINLKTMFLLSQQAARQFVKQGNGGKIINIASMLSYQGGIRVPSYTASKSGVKGLTMEMANELAPKGINVNAIAPGYMETNNTKALREDAVRSKEILARIPAGKWGTPQDIGGACVFLASGASDYIHGFTLAVDGGWLAR